MQYYFSEALKGYYQGWKETFSIYLAQMGLFNLILESNVYMAVECIIRVVRSSIPIEHCWR